VRVKALEMLAKPAACALLLTLLSCSPSDSSRQPPRDTSGTVQAAKIVVTGKEETRSDACQPREAARLVVRFFTAFNLGDQDTLKDFFPTRRIDDGMPGQSQRETMRNFQWYSVSPDFTGHEIDEVLSYFKRRHEQNEVLRLVTISIRRAGSGSFAAERNPPGEAVFVVLRSASDLAPGGQDRSDEIPHFGKGLIDCRREKIILWAMGEQRNALTLARRMCPPSNGNHTDETVVACIT
jgi:hypothetical protein